MQGGHVPLPFSSPLTFVSSPTESEPILSHQLLTHLSGLRLKPGYHLFPGRDGWLIQRPDGAFVKLKVPQKIGAEIASALAGEEDPDSLRPETRSALERFRAAGMVESAPESCVEESTGEGVHGEGTTVPRLRVVLEGDGPITDALAQLLEAGGNLHRPGPSCSLLGLGQTPPEVCDLLISCAGWLPDEHWQRLDEWCGEHRIARHSCYREGNRFYLGPMWLPDDPATCRYADVRARRLAAASFPEGLEDLWQYLDSGRRAPAPQTSASTTAVIAGTLAADVLAWTEGRRPPSHGHQLAYEPATATWVRHPVLPVPRGLMTECQA